MQMSSGGGETPARAGLTKAFWKWLEPDPTTPLLQRGCTLGACSVSPLLPPLPFTGPAGRSINTQQKTLLGASRPCFAIPVPLWQWEQSAGESEAALLPAARTSSWRPDYSSPPLQWQVLTKLCHRCRVYVSPCICFYSGCSFKPKVVILYDPQGALE